MLRLWVQPGGSSDNQTLALGPMGRDNILNFAARDGASVYATCAGYYYSAGAEPRRRCSRLLISSTLAGSYWWFDKFYPSAWMMHLWPTVEGPISPIAVCAQPCSRSPRRPCCYLPHILLPLQLPRLCPYPPVQRPLRPLLGRPSARFEQDNSRHPQRRCRPRLLRTRRPAP